MGLSRDPPQPKEYEHLSRKEWLAGTHGLHYLQDLLARLPSVTPIDHQRRVRRAFHDALGTVRGEGCEILLERSRARSCSGLWDTVCPAASPFSRASWRRPCSSTE